MAAARTRTSRMIFPDMSAGERRAIVRASLDNVGRTIIENYSPEDQLRDVAVLQPRGPGWPAIEAARKAKTPIVFVSAHFGNWQAARAALNQRGYDIGGLYRPFNNPYVNAHYVESIERVGGRAYARSRHGIAAFLRTLRAGGQAAMMLDQYVADGEILDFLGHPAPTSLSAAEMALRHDALLVPIYGLRLADGFEFEMRIEAPIPPSDPETMTQALNDSLAADDPRRAEPVVLDAPPLETASPRRAPCEGKRRWSESFGRRNRRGDRRG
jgi:KDO2-lipid IV(A) lauroyltransferase